MPENIMTFGAGGQTAIQRHPDTCPICHNRVSPVARFSILEGDKFEGGLRVLYSCPNIDCREIFIGYFSRTAQNQIYELVTTRPSLPKLEVFSEFIKTVSPNFCDIYVEANTAEQLELTKICGVGYRKALEFLIKDYLIGLLPKNKEVIESSALGTCIENCVTDPRVKEVSRRATWLGNDETHYQRRWVDKDLGDLKSLITLVLHWIEIEHLTSQALQSMPPKS